MSPEVLNGLLGRIGQLAGGAPRQADLYTEAVTHTSWVNEAEANAESNQRLEYLGDAVLQLAVADYLFRRYPERAEGDLTRLRAAAVQERSLAQAARSLGIGECLRLGRGEESTGGRDRTSLLADAFEAITGALYLDLGFRFASRFALTVLAPVLQAEEARPADKDPKTLLQEWVQRSRGGSLSYDLIEASGPDHDKRFRVAVVWQGRRLGEGLGRTKKEAEQRAAEAALEGLRQASCDDCGN